MLRKQSRRQGQSKRLAEIFLIPAPTGVRFETALRLANDVARFALSLVTTPHHRHNSACDAQCQNRRSFLSRLSLAIRRSFRGRNAIRKVRRPREDGLLLGRCKRGGALAQFTCPTVDRRRSRRRNAARMRDKGKESLASLPAAADQLAHLPLVRLTCKLPQERTQRRSGVANRAKDGSHYLCQASDPAALSARPCSAASSDGSDIESEASASSPSLSQAPSPLLPPSLTLRRSASPCVAGFHTCASSAVGIKDGLALSTQHEYDRASSFVRERGLIATQTSAVAALELTCQHQEAVVKPRRLSICSRCRRKRGSAVEDVERTLEEEHDEGSRRTARRSPSPCHAKRPTGCFPSGSATRQCDRVVEPRQRQKQANKHDGPAWESLYAVRTTQANPDDLTIPTTDRRSFASTTLEASDSIVGGASGGGGGGGEADSSFQTASETVESEEGPDTSGSAMAEHGHSSRGGNSSAGGGSGGGHGGDDSRSSASLSLGRAGEDINGRRYHLRIVQQPSTGSAFGLRTLTRLAIQPPLVVQLRVTNLDNEDVDFDEEIPFLVCRLRLSTEDGMPADMLAPTVTTATVEPDQAPLSAQGPRHSTGNLDDRRQSPPSEQARTQRVVSATPALPSSDSAGTITEATVSRALARHNDIQTETPLSMLYGTLVASPVSLPNQRQRMRTFFIFPEVSVRSSGRFRLHVALMRLPLPTLAAASATAAAGQAPSDASLASASASASPSVPLQAAESTTNTPSTLPRPTHAPESPSDVRETPRQDQRQGAHGVTLATVQSEPFSIVSNADYVAPHITELTRHFAVNGVSLLLPPGHSSND